MLKKKNLNTIIYVLITIFSTEQFIEVDSFTLNPYFITLCKPVTRCRPRLNMFKFSGSPLAFLAFFTFLAVATNQFSHRGTEKVCCICPVVLLCLSDRKSLHSLHFLCEHT